MNEISIYEKWFGVKPLVVAGYPWASSQGGGYLAPEVMEAMNEAAKYKVDMAELLLQSGETVAGIIGAEAAFITSSDCAAHTLAAVALMTGKDLARMEQLPDTEYPIRLKNELIVQSGMVDRYRNCFRASGAELIKVGSGEDGRYTEFDAGTVKTKVKGVKVSPDDIEAAVNERTAGILAAIHCAGSAGPPCTVPVAEVVRIARKHNLPTVVDAPHLPAVGGEAGRAFLRKYLDMGIDLVCASGGKAIDGPNDTAIIYGRKDLIEAAAPQGAPGIPLDAGTARARPLPCTMLGRGFKVSKEQIVGLVAALKRYVALDSKAITARDTELCQWMADQLRNHPGVTAARVLPEADWPDDSMFEGGVSCALGIDEKGLGMKVTEMARLMQQGESPVVLNTTLAPWGMVQLFSHGLRGGEAEVVVRQLKKTLDDGFRNHRKQAGQ